MTVPPDLEALAHHLDGRRELILMAWRSELRRDPELTTGTSLPRTQLDDHVPGILKSYTDNLRGDEKASAKTDDATAHGLHRWQQGYDLREVTRELGRLNGCVVLELETIARTNEFSSDALAAARIAWAKLSSLNITESTAQYYRLQQIEASSHVRDLEHALDELRDLDKRRAELWREAAHDLRGNLGVVVTAASGIAAEAAQEQTAFLPLLERNLASLRHLIDDVTGLARLQAGKEV
ncbi:MAG: histidine kinase, partial [Clostridia bacterium]|nr:histidine kinase [Deltaproteobacteria bacterium]